MQVEVVEQAHAVLLLVAGELLEIPGDERQVAVREPVLRVVPPGAARRGVSADQK